MEVLIFGLNKLKFYSDLRRSGDSYHPDKLIINSTPYNIVFTKQSGVEKSVLLFPPLKSYRHLIENSSEGYVNIDNSDKLLNLLLELKDFHIYLKKVIDSLEPGYYNIEFYFYIEIGSNDDNAISVVYNYDFLNNKCLNKVYGNFGYTIFAFIVNYFEDSREFRQRYYENVWY